MLGGSCSPCCSQCKPSVIPDFIEVDIESSNDSDSYGYLRYRIERNQFAGLCESENTTAIKVRGISSGTYTLSFSSPTASGAAFAYHSDSFSIFAVVQTQQQIQWAGNFGNKFGPGVYVTVVPIRTASWARRWPYFSSLSAAVPTESDLDSITESQSFDENGITNIKSMSYSNGQVTNYQLEAISACVGGNETYTAGAFVTVPRSTLLPWELNASYIQPGFGFVDDYDAIVRWNLPFYQDNCGGAFPGSRGLFIDAGGDYELTSDTISISFSSGGVVIPFRTFSYQLKLIRTLTITALRGLMNDGTLVPLINDPPQA
jgi:hypothetical protein